ncbi:acVLRF1 family peptidyl-tRNA hydrolase [Allokutzneria multivorans]|uniref:AcVLRF1 family peptidyl-tRNA hydrolase n=1 Tax=Allokutzneria multivorans TaxID=1142134 RepID=A0ABP7U2Y8_9PSEU
MRAREVAGGGRAVEIPPERLAGWFARFGDRHGGVTRSELSTTRVVVTAVDGARAEVEVGYGGLALPEPVRREGLAVDELLEHASRPRRIALVLVRLGGHSVGIAENGHVLSSSTDRRQVHGRNKAGGWSQQRFARRREGQARLSLSDAADTVARVLLPELASVEAVVLGGDRQALEALRADRRLGELFARAEPRVLPVAEPRRRVLDEAAESARAVEIVLFDR